MNSVADNEIFNARTINAPLAVVYQAFANPEYLKKWWGPEGFTNTIHEFDLRAGGKWLLTMHGPEKGNYENSAIFKTVEPNKIITWTRISPPLFDMEVAFEQLSQSHTSISFRMIFKTVEECNKMKPYVVSKNEENFDRLERVLSEMLLNNDTNPSEQKHTEPGAKPFAQTYFHGTKADLKVGELITAGFNSNFGVRKNAKYIFLSATLDAAIWGAELAIGDGRERIYLVEPTGQIEDDPDLTDKKFPGNPTKSYRSTEPFKVVGEVMVWQPHPTDQVNTMNTSLEKLKKQGINSLND